MTRSDALDIFSLNRCCQIILQKAVARSDLNQQLMTVSFRLNQPTIRVIDTSKFCACSLSSVSLLPSFAFPLLRASFHVLMTIWICTLACFLLGRNCMYKINAENLGPITALFGYSSSNCLFCKKPKTLLKYIKCKLI